MEEDFFTVSQLMISGSPVQKSKCRTCTERCHSPFKLIASQFKKVVLWQCSLFCFPSWLLALIGGYDNFTLAMKFIVQ